MACEKGYLELVQTLLNLEAMIDHKDQKKKTPLMYAIQAKAQNLDVVGELLQRNADVNAQTVTGLTALLLAAFKKHAGIITMLLKNGADITFQGGDNLNTALHFAVEKGDIQSVNALLDHCKVKLFLFIFTLFL